MTLHESSVMHRDIKSANIFLYKDGTAKLGDLNVSKVIQNSLNYTQTGTPYYASPEVWRDQPYDTKSDIWSLGCVIYEMMALKPPFRADDMPGLYKKILRGYLPKISHKEYNDELYETLRSMVQVKAKLRPTCREILDTYRVAKMRDLYFPDVGKPKNNLRIRKQRPTTHATNLFSDENEFEEETKEKIDMMKTIYMPRSLANLDQRLPDANYEIMVDTNITRTEKILPDLKNDSVYTVLPSYVRGTKYHTNHTKLLGYD